MSWVRVLLAWSLLISCHAPLFALDGRVVDQRNGAPLPNAEVSILGLAGVVHTDENGRFTWKPDPVPPFEVLVVLPGGRVLKPVLVETLVQGRPLVVAVQESFASLPRAVL